MKRYAVGRKVKGIIRKKGLFLQDGYKIEEKSDGMIFRSKNKLFCYIDDLLRQDAKQIDFQYQGRESLENISLAVQEHILQWTREHKQPVKKISQRLNGKMKICKIFLNS